MAIKGEEKWRREGTGLYTVGVGCNWLFMGYDVLYKACVVRIYGYNYRHECCCLYKRLKHAIEVAISCALDSLSTIS